MHWTFLKTGNEEYPVPKMCLISDENMLIFAENVISSTHFPNVVFFHIYNIIFSYFSEFFRSYEKCLCIRIVIQYWMSVYNNTENCCVWRRLETRKKCKIKISQFNKRREKCVIQREIVLSNAKSCYPTRKPVIHLENLLADWKNTDTK